MWPISERYEHHHESKKLEGQMQLFIGNSYATLLPPAVVERKQMPGLVLFGTRKTDVLSTCEKIEIT